MQCQPRMPTTLDALFSNAIIRHKQGKRHEAYQDYQRILSIDPHHSDTLHMLGVLACESGRPAVGVRLMNSAMNNGEPTLQRLRDLAAAHDENGDVHGAVSICRRVLALNPADRSTALRLAALLLKCNDLVSALTVLEGALTHHSADAALLNRYGVTLRASGRRADARRVYKQALLIAPDEGEIWFNLGVVAQEDARFDEAVEAYQNARAAGCEDADVLNNLGLALRTVGRLDEAAGILDEALSRWPDVINLQVNAAGVALDRNDIDRAICYFKRVVQQVPHAADLRNNLGIALQAHGDIPGAMAQFEQAASLDPRLADARFNLGLAQLLTGNFTQGWANYEYRWYTRHPTTPPREFSAPLWKGESLAEKTLFVYGEQGLGDEIMFASLLPDLVSEAGHCVTECSPKLEKLWRRSFPSATVRVMDRSSRDWASRAVEFDRIAGGFDVQVPVGSVPLYRRPNSGVFRSHTGYLRADPERIKYWHDRLIALKADSCIGISWRGGTPRTARTRRSMLLDELLPILRTQNTAFISLQYDECEAELAQLRAQHAIDIISFPEALADYDETAALVTALDQVISVCTAVVHLGGALGRPVWVMTPYMPEWRYGYSGSTMPWYPSVRLFRQPKPGAWPEVVECVTQELMRQRTANGGNHSGTAG